ncbi:Uncharacterised protein [Chlamydia abortus]|nr:Uncharacterised protein [Chlamydia abortus]
MKFLMPEFLKALFPTFESCVFKKSMCSKAVVSSKAPLPIIVVFNPSSTFFKVFMPLNESLVISLK